ncbi:MAG TPA: TIGR03086 family metal-binding protein [Mycobacteriales bacterium]|nr:TIGR03086 family metal-binding protein [Mycobacteriales bacterium]
MTEVADRYRRIADGFTTRLDGVAADGWDAASPCDEWTGRDIVEHVVATHRRVRAALDGTEAEPVDPEGDLRAQWRAARAEIESALADPVMATTVVGGMFGEQPFESLVGRLLCADTLIHTWDLARATGQDDRLDPDGVAKAFEFLTPIDEAIRRPGGFGPKLEPPTDADEQARFLAFCGRSG